jgi:glycosyltransferase involved in cell wall biosynthesis
MSDVSDAEMPAHFAAAKAFLFASYEDFGVTPVEALAAGTPVIAFGQGGALDYVEHGKTGELFLEQTVESLKAILSTFDNSLYDVKALKDKAQAFSASSFNSKLQRFIASKSSK